MRDVLKSLVTALATTVVAPRILACTWPRCSSAPIVRVEPATQSPARSPAFEANTCDARLCRTRA
jgi:hypothetical protein